MKCPNCEKEYKRNYKICPSCKFDISNDNDDSEGKSIYIDWNKSRNPKPDLGNYGEYLKDLPSEKPKVKKTKPKENEYEIDTSLPTYNKETYKYTPTTNRSLFKLLSLLIPISIIILLVGIYISNDDVISKTQTITSMPPNTVQPTTIPPTTVPPTSMPPTSVPPTSMPPTTVPPTSMPPTAVPPTAMPPTPLPTPYVPITTKYQNHEVPELNFSLIIASDSNLKRFAISPGHPNFENREILYIYDEKADVDFVISVNIAGFENDEKFAHSSGELGKNWDNPLGIDNLYDECYLRNPYENEKISTSNIISFSSSLFRYSGLSLEGEPFKSDFENHLPPTSYKSIRVSTYHSKFNYENKGRLSIKAPGKYVARQFCFEMDGLIFNFTVSSKTDPFKIIGMADNPFCFTDNSRDFSGKYRAKCNLSNFENETKANSIRIKQFFNSLETIKLLDVDKNKSLPLGQLKADYSDWN